MIGKTISHYKILEKLGGGGMGVVYKAEDLKLDRFVALKFLPPTFTLDEDAKQRFIHEAKAASALEHNNICTIHEIDETDDLPDVAGGQIFIVMSCYEGETLKKKIERGPLKIDEAIDLITQIASGLLKAHEQGIVHRDIKPANIFFTNDGVVKILDFGLAKVTGQTQLTQMGSTVGTVSYMSPEQTRGEMVDQRTDIWSLGVVLYEMLTGERPFKGDYEQAVVFSIVNEEPMPVKKVNFDVPAELEEIIDKALRKNTELRYSSTAEMLKDLKAYQDSLRVLGMGTFNLKTIIQHISKPRILVPAAVIILLIILSAVWFFNRQAKINWAREEVISQVSNLLEVGLENFIPAYELIEKAEEFIPDDKNLKALLSQCAVHTSIRTTPPGAKIYFKEYKSPEKDWKYLGISPIKNIRLAAGFFRWKIEKKGYETVIAMSQTFNFSVEEGITPLEIGFKLDKTGTIPVDIVRVPGNNELADFFIDKFEVTNKQYKKFLDQGGYQNKKYWENEFILDGKIISWEEAMSMFVDQTSRPGPSTWLAGSYPAGKENYPVSGLSWFEAAAYAEFAGKSLPSIYHWNLARNITSLVLNNSLIKSMSNFGTDGPVAVGTYEGITASGAYDMAGNVREWCWNKSSLGRCIRGGAWNDNDYMFGNISQLSPFDRSDKNGLRCVKYLQAEKIPTSVFEKYELRYRDYSTEKPVPDDIFQVYKNLYAYDPRELDPKVEIRDESSADWIKEKVSFTAAYGDELMSAIIFLPKNIKPPYQAVIYFPGSSAVEVRTSDNIEINPSYQYYLLHIVKNHRAVVYPIYKGTFERKVDFSKMGEHQLTEWSIQCAKDFSRTIDYLETRPDIASDKLAFYGMSWGGRMGFLIPAVEKRLKANILIVGGLSQFKDRPEVDIFNFITRIKIPTLMLNGRFDMVFPYKTHVKPAYDLLGTPEEDKKLILYDTDHFIPKNGLIKETLNWLDKYLGPVK